MNAIEIQTAAMTMFAKVVEHWADQTFIQAEFLIDAGLRQQVSCDLFANQLIKTDIAIECTCQIVTVFPRALCWDVPFVTVRVGVSNDIHPVTRKSFAKVG